MIFKNSTNDNNRRVYELLEQKYLAYNNISFLENDPIQIPHLFSRKEDIEIAGLFAATLAWGQRKSIIKNSRKLMHLMADSPYDFIMNHSKKDFKKFQKFAHRTFNGKDCVFFIERLSIIYKKYGGLEKVFSKGISPKSKNIETAILSFRDFFLGEIKPNRSFKHLANPNKNSSAKRICMYLRWMVRKDSVGCDFGIWKKINSSQLCLPLDIHSGNISRKLGLLNRKQNDWKAVIEITDELKKFDPNDPVKYDYALFGMGANNDLSI